MAVRARYVLLACASAQRPSAHAGRAGAGPNEMQRTFVGTLMFNPKVPPLTRARAPPPRGAARLRRRAAR